MKKLFGMLIFSLLFCASSHGAEHNELEMEYLAIAHTDEKNEIFLGVDWLNDEQLVTIDSDEVVKVWDVETSQCTLETENREYAKDFCKTIVTNPAQSNLVACSHTTENNNRTTAIRDMRTGKVTQILNAQNQFPVCWNPYGNKLVIDGRCLPSEIHDIRNEGVMRLSRSGVSAATWSPQGCVYVPNLHEMLIRINTSKTDPPNENEYEDVLCLNSSSPYYLGTRIWAIAQQPTTSLCALTCADGLRFCDIEKTLERLHDNTWKKRDAEHSVDKKIYQGPRSIDWHPDGHYFVTCDTAGHPKFTHIRLWKKDTELGSAHVIAEHPHQRTCSTRTPFCPNGNLIAASTNDGQDLGVYRMPDVALLAAATNEDDEEEE